MNCDKCLIFTSLSGISQLYLDRVCIPVSNIAYIGTYSFDDIFTSDTMEKCDDSKVQMIYKSYKNGVYHPACIVLRNITSNNNTNAFYALESFEKCIIHCYGVDPNYP